MELTKEEFKKERQRINSKRRYDKAKEQISERRKQLYLAKKQAQEPIKEFSGLFNQIAEVLPNNTELLNKLSNLEINEGSKKKYISDFKRLLKVIDNRDMVTALRNGAKLIQAIEDSEYSDNTKKGLVQVALFLVTQLDIKIGKVSHNHLKSYFERQKMVSVENNQDKMENQSVPKWSDYLNQVKEKFGVASRMYVLAMLYREVTLRDDFVLKLVAKKPKDTSENYLVLSKNNYQLVINNYKTDKKYGSFVIKLSKGLTNLIQNYIENNNLQMGDYLFGENKLSTYISKATTNAGINGGINLFRHMTVTEELNKIKDITERQALSDRMAHSIFTQMKYIRKFEKD